VVLIGAPILDDAENVSLLLPSGRLNADVLGRWSSRNDGRDPESQGVGGRKGKCRNEGSNRVACSLSHLIQLCVMVCSVYGNHVSHVSPSFLSAITVQYQSGSLII
jgi:hypothetical protein